MSRIKRTATTSAQILATGKLDDGDRVLCANSGQVNKGTDLTGIFKFWSKIGPGAHVHPADRGTLARIKSNFDFSGLPGAWMGPLRNASVVLLYLAPGAWSPDDSVGERSAEVRGWHMRTRGGCEPLPDSDYSLPTWRWWSERTRLFGDWQELRSKIAILNLAPYHSSGEFRDYGLLGKIPSSAVSLQWAREVLFPAARARRRVVVCLRSAQQWGLEVGKDYGGWLFAPQFTRGGHMHHGELRETVVRTVKEALM